MKKIEEMMRLSIFEVFEKMFFIFLESSDINDNEYDIEAAIRFNGNWRTGRGGLLKRSG
ncbi:MAG: hypothetical protein JRC90_09025 [Deltaproteobacteria bacterium]|nr:hypothetical protein [Deltaproteobacteria bacterium]